MEKERSDYLKELKDTANSTVKKGISFGKETTSRLNNSKQMQNARNNAGPIFREIKTRGSETISDGIKYGKRLEKVPSVLQSIGTGSLNALEKIVGRVRIGTQYGKTSLDVLEELSKMKELGIISEEEYSKKKREILDRI